MTYLSEVINIFVLDRLLVSGPLGENLSPVWFGHKSVVPSTILGLVLGKHQPPLSHPGLQGLAQQINRLWLGISNGGVFESLLEKSAGVIYRLCLGDQRT